MISSAIKFHAQRSHSTSSCSISNGSASDARTDVFIAYVAWPGDWPIPPEGATDGGHENDGDGDDGIDIADYLDEDDHFFGLGSYPKLSPFSLFFLFR
jgi:hypothetical protein